MKEKADSPAQVSEIDVGQPNRENPGNTSIDSFATRDETKEALQANDAEKMTPDEANELSSNKENK